MGELLGELVANKGTFILNNTSAKTGIFDAIVVLEDTVFSAITIDGVDSRSTYIADVATAVKAGAIITPTGVKTIEAVQLTSGSVALVRG
jgi:hypothetical protein